MQDPTRLTSGHHCWTTISQKSPEPFPQDTWMPWGSLRAPSHARMLMSRGLDRVVLVPTGRIASTDRAISQARRVH